MTKTSEDTVIALDGTLYYAPTGTTAPTDEVAALDADFIDLGYLTEDAVTFTVERTSTDYMAWQSLDPIRRVATSQISSLAFSLEEVNANTLAFAYGGTTTEPTGDHYKFEPPDPDEIVDWSLLLEYSDGTRDYRLYFPKGSVTGTVAMPINRSAMSVIPVTFSPLRVDSSTKLYTWFSNDATWAPAAS